MKICRLTQAFMTWKCTILSVFESSSAQLFCEHNRTMLGIQSFSDHKCAWLWGTGRLQCLIIFVYLHISQLRPESFPVRLPSFHLKVSRSFAGLHSTGASVHACAVYTWEQLRRGGRERHSGPWQGSSSSRARGGEHRGERRLIRDKEHLLHNVH